MDAAAVDAKVAALPLFASLDADARAQTAAMMRGVSDVLRYEDNEMIIQEGCLSFGTGYLVVDGSVLVEATPTPVELTAPALLGEMAQFKAVDMRNANVRAKGEATALRFYWDDVYTASEKALTPAARSAFRGALERQVWERFPHKEILTLALFSDLPDALKQRVCLPFPSISERVHLQRVETLFNVGSRCKMAGYLLVGGSVRLLARDKAERILKAPDMIGVFPGKPEQGKEWNATAMAEGEAQLLKFSWERYTAELLRRLNRDEQQALVTSFKNNASKHFRH